MSKDFRLTSLCFNSMKVRLKPATDNTLRRARGFQFHEGPIKTKKYIMIFIAFRKFQFHEGPIKT